jgi:hypothetical protein
VEAYLREQPDADQLDISLLHSRYPIRDLTLDERETGELDPAEEERNADLVKRIYAQQ